METVKHDRAREAVPPKALLLSLISLWVPVASSSMFPEWTNEDVGLVVWVLALIPPFLLSYYRGWKGASVALAAGMAAFAGAQILVSVVGATLPPLEIILGLILVLIAVSLGSGALSALFRQSLGNAEEMALTDSGTGLPNRRHGMLHLDRAFAAAERGSGLSVVMFDLDKFKRVNDRFGHHTGDHVLRVFAEVLAGETRAMHLSMRFGGEEFMAVLDGATGEQASRMAERVLAGLRERDFPWGVMTVSAGISEFEEGMASPDVLVAAADQALYRAKARGGDQVVVLARQGRGSASVVPAIAPDVAGEGSGELVLVVDDDPAVLRTLSRALHRRKYRALEATDPLRALQIVRGLDEPLDLVITDLVMPEMSGFRLVEMLLEIQPELRALYISGYSSDEVSWSGVPGKVKSFLPKPISLDALAGAVTATLHADTPEEGPEPTGVTERDERDERDERAGAVSPESVVPDLHDRIQASTARLDEAYTDLLMRLARAAEYRDDVTGQHADRVARLVGLIADRLGLDAEDAARTEQASLLHDLGKIAVPDSILRKPAALTPTERSIMERHTTVGGDLLAGSPHPLVQEAERVARHHHERWDGGGYPEGLAGTAIPLAARITAVADAFDSLTHSRPYRGAIAPDAALQRIAADSGTHFDPSVVRVLIDLSAEGVLSEISSSAGEWMGQRPALALVT